MYVEFVVLLVLLVLAWLYSWDLLGAGPMEGYRILSFPALHQAIVDVAAGHQLVDQVAMPGFRWGFLGISRDLGA